ncbi:MAG: 16S rRNA (guanine(966)-N(2))-methyltransferase RsmD [Sandaracinobacteroides sp.]
MRIIAGTWRSRPLDSPPGDGTRPTSDRARETLFSMLVSRLGSFEGMTVLDLFAGSGALALEALSRGAAKASLVENDPAARKAIEANIKRLGAEARLIGHDACHLPPTIAPVDLIFLDPPYKSGLWLPALASAQAMGWVAPYCWASIESARGEKVDAPGFQVEVERPVGKATLTLLRAIA